MSDTDIGTLLIVLGALWRIFGASERPQEMFDLKYNNQKEQLGAGTPFKKYSRQLAYWQSVFQVKTTQVETELAETLLSLTTETDLVVLQFFEEPAKAVTLYEFAAKDLTLMFRSLSKREELECEKIRTYFAQGRYVLRGRGKGAPRNGNLRTLQCGNGRKVFPSYAGWPGFCNMACQVC